MPTSLIPTIQTVLAAPDSPDLQALVPVIVDERAAIMVACLAPAGTFAQVAAAIGAEMPWLATGWERHTDALVGLMTDHRWSLGVMFFTWTNLPGAVGVLRGQTTDLILWAERRMPEWMRYSIAILLGPSDESAILLYSSDDRAVIGDTLRRWSMATVPEPTAWQAQVAPDILAALRDRADPSTAFSAWGWDDDVDVGTVVTWVVIDLTNGWSPDHPSIRGRIAWLERHVTPDLPAWDLAILASLSGSDALAAAVCERISREPLEVSLIASTVPWRRLHPQIRGCTGDDGWAERYINERVFRLWNPDVSQTDLQARAYANLILRQMHDRDIAVLTDFLSVLTPERRVRFERIIGQRVVAVP